MDEPMFRWNAYFMRTIGMYKPNKEWGFLRKIGYYFGNLIWMVALIGGVTTNILRIVWAEKLDKISDVAMNILYIELYTSITLRSFYFARDNTGIDRLCLRMVQEFKHSTKMPFKPKTMENIRKYNDWLILGWMIFILINGGIMCSTGLFKTPKELPYDVWTWYDLGDPYNYTLTLLVEIISLEVMLISYGNLDMLNSTFMLLTSAQVDILATDFANVVHRALKENGCTEEEVLEYLSYGRDESVNKQRIELDDKINRTLETKSCKRDLIYNIKYCIEHHQKLLDFIQEYQSYMSPYLLVEVNFNFSYMIFMLFIMATTDNTSIYVPMGLYLCACVIQIFMAMYFGDRLMSSIEDMRHRLYDMPWYLCDNKFLINFKIVQIRMSKIIVITAGKLLKMSLDTFLEFMRRAFSFFSVLRQTRKLENILI